MKKSNFKVVQKKSPKKQPTKNNQPKNPNPIKNNVPPKNNNIQKGDDKNDTLDKKIENQISSSDVNIIVENINTQENINVKTNIEKINKNIESNKEEIEEKNKVINENNKDISDPKNNVNNEISTNTKVQTNKKQPLEKIESSINQKTQIQMMPVGFKNVGNTCYSNSILQVILATTPFTNILYGIKNKIVPNLSPILLDIQKLFLSVPHRTVEELNEEIKTKGNLLEGICKNPKVVTPPVSLTTLLKSVGREEDAQEFLSVLLEKLHDECRQFQKISTKPKKKKDGWKEVGKNNTTTTVVNINEEKSVIQEIFSTRMRHNVKKGGNNASLKVQVIPYYYLPIEISDEEVVTVKDGLKRYMQVERVTDIKKRTFVSASIDVPPKILILYLQRFVYCEYGGIKKIDRFVSYHKNFSLKKFLFNKNEKNFNYNLYAVVSHHGKTANTGHYTADILQPEGSWVCFNDSKVSVVDEKDVLERNAYLLFYTLSK